MPPVTLSLDGKTTVIRHSGITPVPVRVRLSQGGYWPGEAGKLLDAATPSLRVNIDDPAARVEAYFGGRWQEIR